MGTDILIKQGTLEFRNRGITEIVMIQQMQKLGKQKTGEVDPKYVVIRYTSGREIPDTDRTLLRRAILSNGYEGYMRCYDYQPSPDKPSSLRDCM